MVKKIKRKTHTKKLRGRRAHQHLQAVERERELRQHQVEAHRRRITKQDEETGEIYILSRLTLESKEVEAEYRRGLDSALDGLEDTAEQAAAIRRYLQACVDGNLMKPVPCARGTKPTCRQYIGKGKRVVVLTPDDEEYKTI